MGSPLDDIVTDMTGEPPEIRYLRKMYDEARQEAVRAQQRCAALSFALSQHEIFCTEDEDQPNDEE